MRFSRAHLVTTRLAASPSSSSNPPPPSPPILDDDEAVEQLEKVMRAQLSAGAARTISRAFLDIGVHNASELRKLILNDSLLIILGHGVRAAGYAALALVMFHAKFHLLVPLVPGDAGGAARIAVDVALVVMGSFYVVEALAATYLFFTFIYTAVFFGTTNLSRVYEAMEYLGRADATKNRGGVTVGGTSSSSFSTLPFVPPGVLSATLAARVTQKLNDIRGALMAERDTMTENMSTMQTLAAFFELDNAEKKEGFQPSRYGLTEAEALRIAAVFGEWDTNADGSIEESELKNLMNSVGAPCDVMEVRAAMHMLDTQGTGSVTLEEFTAWFAGGCPTIEKIQENARAKQAKAIEATDETGGGAKETVRVSAVSGEPIDVEYDVVDADWTVPQ